jgi:LEA14-like dessication related protein
LFLFTGCGGIQDIEVKDVKNIRFKGLVDNYVTFEADIQVFNPSHTNIRVKEIDVKVYANDSYVGRLLCDQEVFIPSESSSIITTPFRLRITNILTGASMYFRLSKQKDIKIEVDGHIWAKTMLIRKKIKIHEMTYINSLK